ncbi:peptidase M52 [Rhizocola hellebori]|uniref:Peptidase M52 n=1 Tax=Rhizocola hellebori TaxID=1392758 RepID=A0A8J3Q6R2_9ACTN|nr:hydrogenase maturation protease [Rhizocola hellebori]GIH04860.1 peptidase M52 [Rhizocola hellebori]
MNGILVAGVGNIFLGDDGFGVEVASRLSTHPGSPLPEGIKVRDFGIRGMHLAYELLDGYDGLILVDAVQRGGEPGEVYLIEPDLDDLPASEAPAMDAHSMSPDTVFALLKALGGTVKHLYVVGCEPADLGERMGLSPAVAAAVDGAVLLVRDLALQLHARREDPIIA